jgi:7-cyano-7-deazaguanine synthase in queuosine biosynthesis
MNNSMLARFIQAEGWPGASGGPEEAIRLDWRTERRNAGLTAEGIALPEGVAGRWVQDLVDVATAVYLSDLATPRGQNEQWLRELELELAVREIDFWKAQEEKLSYLLYVLTHDNYRFTFHSRTEPSPLPAADPWIETDCVCLLSGGLDSAAGSAALLHTGRHPRLVVHSSGNPTVAAAQDHILDLWEKKWAGEFARARVRLAPSAHRTGAWEYPPPEQRETSRRSRSFLYLALGVAAAWGEDVAEVYLYDNAVLTAAVPLSEARASSFTTHSTHPQVLQGMNELVAAAGGEITCLNPFAYQTKGEVIRTHLRPYLTPGEIEATVSCWRVGRQQRQCGTCVPCLLRRIGLLAAGLPDEVYEDDLLAKPLQYRGTEGWRNLIDLLGWTSTVLATPRMQMAMEYSSLLSSAQGGANLLDVIDALRRQAGEVFEVVSRHFPAAAKLMAGRGQ